jgi:hypothetical protein
MNSFTRFAFLTASAAYISRLFAQTKTESAQMRFDISPNPTLFLVLPDGSPKQVFLGPGFVLTNTGGAYTLNVAASAAERPDTQQLVLEPDSASWSVPVPITKPQVYRNGLRMLLTFDYTLEGDATKQIVRPTPSQKMKITDTWLAC